MNYLSFLIYCVIVTFTPGPTNIVILSITQTSGVKKAAEYTMGATLAFGLLLATSAAMNGLLVQVLPTILPVMQLVGAFYILYLAYKIYHSDMSGENNKYSGSFVSGVLMQFANPKVIMFTMTVIPSFVMPYYQSALALTLNVLVITFIGFLAFCTWVLFGTVFREFLLNHQKTANTVMALFLVYSAVVVSGITERLIG